MCVFGPTARAHIRVPNTTQTELTGHAVKPPATRVADNMLDLTTAVFLLRKSVEEMSEHIYTMMTQAEWYLTYTFAEYIERG